MLPVAHAASVESTKTPDPAIAGGCHAPTRRFCAGDSIALAPHDSDHMDAPRLAGLAGAYPCPCGAFGHGELKSAEPKRLVVSDYPTPSRLRLGRCFAIAPRSIATVRPRSEASLLQRQPPVFEPPLWVCGTPVSRLALAAVYESSINFAMRARRGCGPKIRTIKKGGRPGNDR